MGTGIHILEHPYDHGDPIPAPPNGEGALHTFILCQKLSQFGIRNEVVRVAANCRIGEIVVIGRI